MVKKQTSMDDVISDFINNLALESNERWLLDPKNQDIVDDLKEALKERAHIRIDLDELDEDDE